MTVVLQDPCIIVKKRLQTGIFNIYKENLLIFELTLSTMSLSAFLFKKRMFKVLSSFPFKQLGEVLDKWNVELWFTVQIILYQQIHYIFIIDFIAFSVTLTI